MSLLKTLTLFCLLVGSSIAGPTGRVVNGTNAEEGEFPFIASLRSYDGSHNCGCSVLNKYWILTAAHCVLFTEPSRLSVQYGVTDISTTGPTVAKLAEVVVHEAFSTADNYKNDIAVLRLEEPLVFDDFVQPIKLPPFKFEVPERSQAVLVGWGRKQSGGSVQKHLQKVELLTYSDEECYSKLDGRTHPSQICGGVPGGGKGQCNGDSGGPLVYEGQQVGVVSWSIKPCGVPPYPEVYTKVSHFVDWIESKVGQVYH